MTSDWVSFFFIHIKYIIISTLYSQSFKKNKKNKKSLHKIIEDWRIFANFMPKYVIL